MTKVISPTSLAVLLLTIVCWTGQALAGHGYGYNECKQVKGAADAAARVARIQHNQAYYTARALSNMEARLRGQFPRREQQPQMVAAMRGYIQQSWDSFNEAIARHQAAAALYQQLIGVASQYNRTYFISQGRTGQSFQSREVLRAQTEMNRMLAFWQGKGY